MESLFSGLVLTAIALFLASAIAFSVALVTQSTNLRFASTLGSLDAGVPSGIPRAAHLLGIAGCAALAFAIADRAAVSHRPPYGDLFEYLVVMSFGIAAVYLWLTRHGSGRRVGPLVMLLAALTSAAATALLPSRAEPLTPALQNNRLLAIHVACMIAAYSALAVAFAASLVSLAGAVDRPAWLPAQADAEWLEHQAILIGFPLLGLGIALGAYWGNIAWGRYWGWDPKETTALASWLVYAGYMHARVLGGWKGRRASLLSVAGFAVILFNVFVVNFALAGLHSYAGA